MKPNILLLLAVLLWGPAKTVVAQDQPLTPTETARLLKSVKGLKGKLKQGRYGIHASSIQAFRSAASSTVSAYEFYLKCYKEINFTRKGAKESEYRDWKSKNKDSLSSREHATARQLQLKFLILTLRAAQLSEEEGFEKMVPELTTLMDNCLSAYPHLGKSKRILHASATGSTFADVYDLQSTLSGLKNWARAPMDISGIYETTILPIYRSPERVKELTAAWDKRISQQITLVAAANSTEAEMDFTNKTLPRLKWLKYMDLLRAGKKRVALTGMVALVKSNVEHQDIDSWLEELEGYLSGELEPGTFEDAAKKAEALASRRKQDSGLGARGGNAGQNEARQAIENFNGGSRRGGRSGRGGIPENVDIDQLRNLFNRR